MAVTINEILYKVFLTDPDDKKNTAGKPYSADDAGDCCGSDDAKGKEVLDEMLNTLDSGYLPGIRTSKR